MQPYLATNLSVSTLWTLLSFIPMFPLLLRANTLIACNVSHQGLQLLWVILAGLVLQFLVTSAASGVASLGYVVVLMYSPGWLAAFLTSLCLACSLARNRERKREIRFRTLCICVERESSHIHVNFNLPTTTSSLHSHAPRLANLVPISQEAPKPASLAHRVHVLSLMAIVTSVTLWPKAA